MGFRNEESPLKASFQIWLGYLDSNQGMAASKAAALPLGDTPIVLCYQQRFGAKGET